MSTRVKVYIYEEDMDKEPLRSRGFLDTGVESLIQKCKNTEEENSEEWDKLLTETETLEVGVDYGDESLTNEISAYLRTLREINNNLINEVEEMVEYYNEGKEILEWLKTHKGKQVFAVAH